MIQPDNPIDAVRREVVRAILVTAAAVVGRIAFSRGGAPVKVLADVYGVTPKSRLGVLQDGFTLDLNRHEDLAKAAGEVDEGVFIDGNHDQSKQFGEVHRMLGVIYARDRTIRSIAS